MRARATLQLVVLSNAVVAGASPPAVRQLRAERSSARVRHDPTVPDRSSIVPAGDPRSGPDHRSRQPLPGRDPGRHVFPLPIGLGWTWDRADSRGRCCLGRLGGEQRRRSFTPKPLPLPVRGAVAAIAQALFL